MYSYHNALNQLAIMTRNDGVTIEEADVMATLLAWLD